MTIQSSLRKAGPFLGDASNTAFPFSFKVFTANDLVVTYLDTYGVESTLALTTDYTLTLNSDQDNAPGGLVNMVWTPAIGTRITLTTAIDYTQTLELTNSGGFYPTSINNALDKIVVQIQQIYERIQRTLELPLSSTGTPELGVPSAGQTIVFDATGSPTLITASTGTSLANLASSTGSAIVGYTQGDSGAIANTVQSKQRERISVKDFGADPTGTLDATSAFSLCAKSGSAIVNEDNPYNLPSAPTCVRYIPAGTYKLASLVDVGNRHVIWMALGEVKLVKADGTSANTNLNGRLHKEGQAMGNNHFGIRDYANSLSIVANRQDFKLDAGVDGFTSESALNTFYSRDSVALYTYIQTPPCLLSTTSASYTATTVTITAPSADTVKKYRVGMLIDTLHSPKFSAILRSWSTDGSVLTVGGWYQSPASTITGATTPTGTAGIILSPVTKVWGQNTIVELYPIDSTNYYATRASGYELSMYNRQSSATNSSYDVWGYDVSTLGTYTCDIAHVARGDWKYGFYYTLPNRTSAVCSAGNFVVGNRYIIQSLGTTVSFTTIGASSNTVNTVFVATGVGATGIGVAQQVYGAGEFTLSYSYTIATSGATGFTGIGAADNNVGTTFLYNGNNSTSVVGYATMNPNTAAAFAFDGDSSLILGNDSVGNQFFKVSSTGSILMGNTNLAYPNYIDFHSSGNSNWDARIICNGGSSTNGQGALNLYADSLVLANNAGANNTAIRLLSSTVYIGGNLAPNTDNTQDFGSGSKRWKNLYLAGSTIATSDARLKQDIAELTDAEKRVAVRLKGLIRTFKFTDAIALKGDNARIHVGVIAQEVQSAFLAEGLNGFDYGLLCYDEWDAKPAVLDAEGNTLEPAQEAGNRYGIRYEELLAFIISAL